MITLKAYHHFSSFRIRILFCEARSVLLIVWPLERSWNVKTTIKGARGTLGDVPRRQRSRYKIVIFTVVVCCKWDAPLRVVKVNTGVRHSFCLLNKVKGVIWESGIWLEFISRNLKLLKAGVIQFLSKIESLLNSLSTGGNFWYFRKDLPC